MRPPSFWDTDNGRSSGALARALLGPLGAAYAWAGARRIRNAKPAQAGVPVICVGNLSVGGTGKTPVSLAILERLMEMGRAPAALSRGWKGRVSDPALVDIAAHTAADVGDEPLLLARRAPTVISGDRPAGAALAVENGADVIVMDDGHQNPSLAKDISLVVVDGQTGWGPGTIFPAGPLREPVEAGLGRADAVIVMTRGPDDEPDYARLRLAGLDKPVLRAWLAPSGPAPQGRLLAFAGIGRPQKFIDGLKAAGGDVAEATSFPDHHPYDEGDLNRLFDLAEALDARPITTEKDWVRLPAGRREAVLNFPVEAVFAEPARLDALLERAVDGARPPA